MPRRCYQDEEITEENLGVINVASGFHELIKDELCRERTLLRKKNFVSGCRYIKVAVINDLNDPTNI